MDLKEMQDRSFVGTQTKKRIKPTPILDPEKYPEEKGIGALYDNVQIKILSKERQITEDAEGILKYFMQRPHDPSDHLLVLGHDWRSCNRFMRLALNKLHEQNVPYMARWGEKRIFLSSRANVLLTPGRSLQKTVYSILNHFNFTRNHFFKFDGARIHFAMGQPKMMYKLRGASYTDMIYDGKVPLEARMMAQIRIGISTLPKVNCHCRCHVSKPTKEQADECNKV